MSDERPVSPAPLNHYLQNALSPRSRSEYDNFNRFHFSQLRHLRDRRAVTPKVTRGAHLPLRQQSLLAPVCSLCPQPAAVVVPAQLALLETRASTCMRVFCQVMHGCRCATSEPRHACQCVMWPEAGAGCPAAGG